MRLLNEEEILEAMNRQPFDCVRHISLSDGYLDEVREIAKAQQQLDLKEFVELVNSKIVRLENRIEELNRLRKPLIDKLDEEEWTIDEDMFMHDSVKELFYSQWIIKEFQSLKQLVGSNMV